MNLRHANDKTENRHPQPGDVVITRHGRSRSSFGLSTMHDKPQLTFTSFEQALAKARGFAGHARVNVWVAEGAGDVRLVANHRAGVQQPRVSAPQGRQ
jgi:hypothetical protein